jgi:hypothetical protein
MLSARDYSDEIFDLTKRCNVTTTEVSLLRHK